MNMLLGWMRALTDAVWRLLESPDSNRFFAGFGTGWLVIALVLIGIGIVIDWVVWMIRWQPYHVWATRLRAIRRLFGRPVEIVEPVGYDDYNTMQYMPAGQAQAGPVGYGGGHDGDYDDGYDDGYHDDYDDYDDGYNADEEYEACEPHRAYAADADDDADLLAAYRRPPLQFPTPPTIPDSQLRDYPGKRYDPARMPQTLPRDTVLEPLDPLAAYDAYPGAAAAQLARPDPLDAPIGGERAGAARRRANRRAAADAGELIANEPAEQDAVSSRRRRRAQRTAEELPVQAYGEPHEAPYEEAYDQAYDQAYGDSYDQGHEQGYEEPYGQEEAFGTDDLPDAPKWPQWGDRKPPHRAGKQPKDSFLGRVRKLGEAKPNPYGAKKRGMISQMLDPQADSIRGLPPMVDMRSAFQKPTYPEPYGREPESDGNPWDEDI